MKSLSARLLTVAMGVLALAASPARADYMNWEYSTAATPPVVASGTGTIQMTGITNGTSAASIALLGLQNSSSATAGSPDVYNAPYSLALTITDNATNDSRTLTLSGLLKGDLTATTSTVTNTLSGVNSVSFDGHTYTVTIPPLTLTHPGAPQQTLNATISVTNATGGPTVPEPASLVLSAMGFSFLGLGRWCKRQRRSAASA
jgi:hypothetical protein